MEILSLISDIWSVGVCLDGKVREEDVMKVDISDIRESHHRDPSEVVAVTETGGGDVGEMFVLQTALVDHGLQVPEH